MAQLATLAPLPGAVVVKITSSPSGARVGGTVTVPASATSPLGVACVQFKLDGANLGTEDTTAPYSVSWDTAVESMTPGAQATFTFNGTSISCSGYRGPDARTARVYLDGSFAGEVGT